MSAPQAQPGNVKDFLQELRVNRKTQGMALVFLAVLLWMLWMFWPEQKKARPRPGSGATGAASVVLGDQQLNSLNKLPDLAKAAGAGELPKTSDMARDLFLFDLPQRIVVYVQVEVPPIPPPTEEEIAERKLKEARDLESASRPSGARYLGYITSKRLGQVGAFMKGEEALTLPIGDLSFRGWKLMKLDDTGAEFQNLRFSDLRHKIQPADGAGPGGQTNVRNDF
jgi:hypothetical protein